MARTSVDKLLKNDVPNPRRMPRNSSLPDVVDVHLRAEKNLPPATAKALSQMFRAVRASDQKAGIMKANYQRWIEGQANVLRDKCELGPFDQLDPFDLAERMEIEVIGPHAIAGLDSDVLAQLLNGGARNWSGERYGFRM